MRVPGRALGLLLLLASSFAGAQTPTVRSLYENESFIPGVLIPFQLQGPLIDAGAKILSVTKLGEVSADCRTMVDPFHSSIFHLKCAAPATLTLKIRFQSQGQVYSMDYGTIEVVYPDPNLVPVDPGEVEDPNVKLGKNLYNAYCHACHTNHAEKAGRTAAQIQNAINTNSSMKSVSDLKSLSADSIKKIEAYLKTTGGN